MATTPLEVIGDTERDSLAKYISQTWSTYNTQRDEKIELWKELRNYIFATDTTTTTNKTLPWKNSTTLPKLCQIRDNLHSNYISALFPNDEWLQWEGYDQDSATRDKAGTIEAYMSNKTRESHFRTTISDCVYDYIDYGNAFGTVDFEDSYRVDDAGNKIQQYVGPRMRRISPLDIVFNPLARSFQESFKIVRYVKNIAELHRMVEAEPDNADLQAAFAKRNQLIQKAKSDSLAESDKSEAMLVDGFGNYSEYLQSGTFEILEFYGDIYDSVTQKTETGRVITVIDRMYVIRNTPMKTWMGYSPIYHVGWRKRPDNLWAMGPLDNLVGMQYRIDHLENLKADAMDLAILPPLVIAGEVEEFKYGPGEEIHIDENGTVTELARNVQWVIAAEQGVDKLEMRMEQYAGAPREAMGIRSAGEKTMFEVQQLQNAAGRIFQEKTTNFEIEFIEPALNGMLETSKRNLNGMDIVRTLNNDLGVKQFMEITRDDITASGILRPIGARHFAAQAQQIQNLSALANTPIWGDIKPHISAKALSTLVEDLLNIGRFKLMRPNVAVFESQETQRLIGQAQEDLQVEQSTPPPQF